MVAPRNGMLCCVAMAAAAGLLVGVHAALSHAPFETAMWRMALASASVGLTQANLVAGWQVLESASVRR